MHRIKFAVAAFTLLAYGASAGAVQSAGASLRHDAPKGITAAFYACIDKADSDTIAAAACLTQENVRQDHRLNANYKALLGKLDGDQKRSLIEAERAWLMLRDRTAQFEGTLYGKEIVDNLQLSQNEIFATCQRADQLQEYLAIANGF